MVFVGSTAGLVSYEGGASYTAAKHGVHTLAETLRLELNGEPVRVIEIAPGMVRTEEFSLNRLGSAEKADAVYRGVREPLVADDIADCIAWTVTRPAPREHRPDGRPPARPGGPAQSPSSITLSSSGRHRGQSRPDCVSPSLAPARTPPGPLGATRTPRWARARG